MYSTVGTGQSTLWHSPSQKSSYDVVSPSNNFTPETILPTSGPSENVAKMFEMHYLCCFKNFVPNLHLYQARAEKPGKLEPNRIPKLLMDFKSVRAEKLHRLTEKIVGFQFPPVHRAGHLGTIKLCILRKKFQLLASGEIGIGSGQVELNLISLGG